MQRRACESVLLPTCLFSLNFPLFCKSIVLWGWEKVVFPESRMLAEGLPSWSDCKYTVGRMSWPLDFLHLFLNYSMFDTVYNKFAEFRGL